MGEGEFYYLDSVLMGYFLYGLVLVRVSAMVLTAEFFSALQFPLMVRAGMVAFFALACMPTALANFHLPPERAINAADIVMLAGQELVIGLAIGFVSTLIFQAATFAGDIAGQQIGFSMATVMDPTTNHDVSIIGFLWSQIGMLLFLVLNLHLYLIWLVERSFEVLAPGVFAFHPFMLALMEGAQIEADNMLEVGLQIALPVILIMLLTHTIIGFVTRTMPQMNIMAFGLPFQIVLGLMAITFMLPGFVDVMAGGGLSDIWFTSGEDGALRKMLEVVAEMVSCMAPGMAGPGD